MYAAIFGAEGVHLWSGFYNKELIAINAMMRDALDSSRVSQHSRLTQPDDLPQDEWCTLLRDLQTARRSPYHATRLRWDEEATV
jgi:hypothetical protein